MRARLRPGDLGEQAAPVVSAVAVGQGQDPVDLAGVPLPGHVDAGKPEAPGDGDLHGRQLQEPGTTLVRRLGSRLDHGQELGREADAGDLVAGEDAGHATAQDVDGRDERDAQPLGLAPAAQLVEGARVPAHLADGERGARAHLEGQLQELRHEIRLEGLEGVDRAARGEVDAVRGGVTEERQETHRVDVEHRPRATVVAVGGQVAGERQDVREALAGETVGERLEGRAVALATGDVDEDLATHVVDGVAERQGSQADVAAGVVRDGDGADAGVRRELAGLGPQAIAGLVGERPGPGHELGEHETSVSGGQCICEGGHASRWYEDWSTNRTVRSARFGRDQWWA